MNDSSEHMRIAVKLFATLRDQAGLSLVEVDVPVGSTVSALLDALADQAPRLRSGLKTSLIAINQQYAFPEDIIQLGDEVAMFPPVSGGAESAYPEHLAVTSDVLDIDAICKSITTPDTGAVCVFSGAVRGHTTATTGETDTDYLIYESYIPMAERTLSQVAQEIRAKFPKVQGLAIVQRIGKLMVGETTIFVACAAGHRNDGCFEAARYGIDRVKEIAPIWKKEFGPNREHWVEGHYRPTPRDIPQRLGNDGQRSNLDRGASEFELGCTVCGKKYGDSLSQLNCECGGALGLTRSPAFATDRIDLTRAGMWRYKFALIPDSIEPVSIGEGWTPTIAIESHRQNVFAKLESLNPTGSFKDRGASVLVSMLSASGIRHMHDDSSGNAGVALAAYAARAGLEATLFVPESATEQKLAQIRALGATLKPVAGARSAATIEAERAWSSGASFYASHVWNPYAVHAYKSIAYELWEQLGKVAPDAVILPVGQGTQLLGMARGFQDLLEAGLIGRTPRLFGVQAAACAPLWAQRRGSNAPVVEQPTLAEGVRILHPARASAVLAAVEAGKGDIIAIDEDAIAHGIHAFAQMGLLVEPTSALAWAGYEAVSEQLPSDAVIVLVITGSGQKIIGIDRLVERQTAQ